MFCVYGGDEENMIFLHHKKEGKTMTGKPETKVEVEPEVNEKKK